VRRWTLLLAGAALWLFLAAIPALADGGPHVAATNNGSSTLTADSCAGCHRAHTAQGSNLLKTDGEALCLSCHGTLGTGATTNVEDGVQYAVANTGSGGTVAGALRAGGFINARIDSSNPVRVPYPRFASGAFVTTFSSKVPVATSGSAVTSAHLALPGSPITATGRTWGNGGAGANSPVVALECTSCHNPHGNGQYRILNPVPAPTGTGFVAAGTAINVADVRTNPAGAGAAGVRNYTVQWGATLADVLSAAVYPAGTTASATLGDYWRKLQPYNIVSVRNGTTGTTNPTGYYSGDMPEFVPANFATGATGFANASGSNTAWRSQITAWCSTCHTRYNTQVVNPSGVTLPGGFNPPVSPGIAQQTDSGDAVYKFRHGTQNNQCTMCHVAHGSNAKMTGTYSGAFAYPSVDNGTTPGVASASSRLLKVDNRGTCQQCHDPTGTIPTP
jgi:predicted CXXCH cytochrome family protein